MRSVLAAGVKRFWAEEEGAAIVEYAILVALIAVVAVLVVATMGNKVSEKFSDLASKL